MHQHLALLGHKVRDRVTGFEGVVTSITFDLYGCVQGLVSPVMNKQGEIADSRWFDTKRLQVRSSSPVMTAPTFDAIPGGQALPQFQQKPLA
jgi:hypothetical protein